MESSGDLAVLEAEGERGHFEIEWSQLDKRRFFAYQLAMFMGIRALVFPNLVIKTHIQTAAQNRSVLQTTRHIISSKGVLGLWRGFWTVSAGAVPSQLMYISALELARQSARENLGLGVFSSAFVGGFCASLCSQAVVVPVDVVSQRLMLQQEYSSAKQVCSLIWAKEGLRGFYRGLPTSVATYAPFSAVWWSSSSACKHFLYESFPDSDRNNDFDETISQPLESQKSSMYMNSKDMAIHGVSGMVGSFCGVVVSNPVDVVKTRIQTMEQSSGFVSTALHLLRGEGLSAFTKGASSRMMSSMPFSVLGILGYESVKRWSTISID